MAKSYVLSEICRKRGIPVFYIPHGHNYGNLHGEAPVVNFGMDRKYFPYEVDCQLAGLRMNQRILEKNGHSPDKIALCGIPKFEPRKGSIEKTRENARRLLGIGPDEFVVAFPATFAGIYTERISNKEQLSSFENFKLAMDLVKVFENTSNMRLIMKYRPKDILIKPVTEAIESSGGKVALITRDLELLLQGADALFVWSSQVGLEALFYNIPILQFRFPGKPVYLPLFLEGAAICVENLDELPAILARLRGEPGYRQERLEAQKNFLKDNLPDDKLSSAERAANRAEKMILKQTDRPSGKIT